MRYVAADPSRLRRRPGRRLARSSVKRRDGLKPSTALTPCRTPIVRYGAAASVLRGKDQGGHPSSSGRERGWALAPPRTPQGAHHEGREELQEVRPLRRGSRREEDQDDQHADDD